MKNLVTRLEAEAGLNKDQARLAVGIFRDYLIECEEDPDLVEAMKIKASTAAKKAKSKYEDLADQAEEVVEKVSGKIAVAADKAGDKAEVVLDKAKKKLKVVVDRLSDYLDD